MRPSVEEIAWTFSQFSFEFSSSRQFNWISWYDWCIEIPLFFFIFASSFVHGFDYLLAQTSCLMGLIFDGAAFSLVVIFVSTLLPLRS